MSLYLDNEINPIAAANKRECEFIPLHFIIVKLPVSWASKPYKTWIAKNLNGRYFVGEDLSGMGEFATLNFVAAFENKEEATYFALMMHSIVSDFF